jgi:putative transposase
MQPLRGKRHFGLWYDNILVYREAVTYPALNKGPRMGQSLVQIYVHVVFSTKDRRPFFKDRGFREEAYKYLAGTAHGLNCPPQKVGRVEDHVHLLCRLGKQIDISKLVAELKRKSSKWVKERMPNLGDFYWQNGYGAF